MRYVTKFVTAFLLLSFVAQATFASVDTFDNIELMRPDGKRLRETAVTIEFGETTMRVLGRGTGTVLKEWKYDQIKAAEYSYTKNPRWKTGLGLGAASILVPPLLLIAIPVGFTKHRRHWVTIRTENDFAVLKVGKSVRKVFMPAFETRTSIQIKALGDDK